MSHYFDLNTLETSEPKDLFLYDEDSLDFFPEQRRAEDGPRPIIKKRSSYEDPPFFSEFGKKLKTKTVVFRDPICEVRLYDKVAAKRQQWGHATKFSRVKRFCWDNLDDLETNMRRERQKLALWLPHEGDQEYRLMMWRDMQKRRLNRKRRVTGDSLAYLVQGLEISPNCVEVVASKMRRLDERL